MLRKQLTSKQGASLALRSLLREGPVDTLRKKRIYFVKKKAIMPLPPSIQIEVTTLCNFKCITCSRESLPESRLNKSVSRETVTRLMDELPDLREIKLQGLGEPLMTPGIEDMISAIRERNSKIRIYTVTNGSLLLSKKYRDVALMVDDLRVSFDSSKPENFEKIRVNGNYQKILDGIKLLVEQRNASKSKTRVSMDFVATHLNYNEIPELADIAIPLGVDEVGIHEVENFYFPSQKEYRDEAAFIAESRKISGAIKENASELKNKLKAHGIALSYLDSAPMKEHCNWPFNASFITSDGYLTSCSIRMDPNAHNFGNIFNQSFKEIWNSEKYQKFRKAMMSGGSNGVCDHCPD